MELLCISSSVIVESNLSFLSEGVQPATPTWGSIVGRGLDYLIPNPLLSLISGISISIAMIAFNLMEDRLQENFNPKLRKEYLRNLWFNKGGENDQSGKT
jgi:peptide/nickel transport system permease protein